MKKLVLILILAGWVAAPAWAAGESRERQMLRRLQQQMQQINQALTQAEQEKATALADKEQAERELENVRSDTVSARRQLTGERTARNRMERDVLALKTEKKALETRVADLEKQVADSAIQQRAHVQTITQAEAQARQVASTLGRTEETLNTCQKHNSELYAIGRELMVKYREKSCRDALLEAEPFTGLKKVEVENLLEIWRDRLDREKLSAMP